MTDFVARLVEARHSYGRMHGYNQRTCVECEHMAAAIREALEIERKRALAYLDVLATNHPHLQEAYHHAKLNLKAVLQTDWRPDETALREGR